MIARCPRCGIEVSEHGRACRDCCSVDPAFFR